MNYKRLVSMYEQFDVTQANDLLREACKVKEVKADHVDLGKLFVECFGYSEFLACREKRKTFNEVIAERRFDEAQGAVTTAAFLNIQGQIIYSMIMDTYAFVAAVFTPLIPEVPTNFLDGEKIAGVTEIGDEVAVRPEAQPYALAGVGEDYQFTPATLDRGLEVPVTWEALFADRTNVLQDRCKDVGKWGGRNREKRAIDCVIDENTLAHRHNWRGTVIPTYGDNTGAHSWDNLQGTNALVDWNQLNVIEQLMNGITDPYTQEVVDIEGKHLIVPKSLEQTARRIVRQGTIRYTTPGFATSGNVSQHEGDNPYSQKYEVITSKLLAPRMSVKTSWYLGDIGKACRYMMVEKPDVQQAPANNPDEFHRRIVQTYRFNERGAYVVVQPRGLFKSTVT